MHRTLKIVLVLAILFFVVSLMIGALRANAETSPAFPDVSSWSYAGTDFREFEYRKNGLPVPYRFLAIDRYESDAVEGVIWRFLPDGSEIARGWWPKAKPSLRQFALAKGDQWFFGAPGEEPFVNTVLLTEWKSGDDLKATVWFILRRTKLETIKLLRIIPLP